MTTTPENDGKGGSRGIDPDPASAPGPHALRVADLPAGSPVMVEITAGDDERADLARKLDLVALRKLRFAGTIRPSGTRDWELVGRLGATVVQPCVATLQPVTTRIDTDVTRRYLADFKEPEETEIEMPADETAETLGSHIDPAQVMAEALALALPLYPRADGVDPVDINVTEAGKDAMTDADAKPFAGLAGLREQLKNEGD